MISLGDDAIVKTLHFRDGGTISSAPAIVDISTKADLNGAIFTDVLQTAANVNIVSGGDILAPGVLNTSTGQMTGGNITVNGSVTAGSHSAGEICKVHVLPFADNDSSNVTGSIAAIVTRTFTKTANTNILAEINVEYQVNGNGFDSFNGRIEIHYSASNIINGDDFSVYYYDANGGGHRSSGLNDVYCYSDNATAGLAHSGSVDIVFKAGRLQSTDSVVFKQGIIKVTEIWAS